MRTIFYNLLRHPHTLQRLRTELLTADAATEAGLTKPYPSYKDVCDLPYLDACILEGLRLHPPFCLPFERVVPKGGMTVGERYFPEGTIIGMSPYLVNRHKPTFGEDVESWNPERWMVAKELKARREAALLTVSFFFLPGQMYRMDRVLTRA
jgi:cytochrome P450